MSWTPSLDQRVRVRPSAECAALRMFLYCEQRPEPCHVHGYHHGGHLSLHGHLAEEDGLVGEITAHMSGENGGHPWIVRYDLNQDVTWTDGQTLVVNGGMYAVEELEPAPDLGRFRIVTAADLPPLGFVGTMPRPERFHPATMEDQPFPDRDYVRPRGKPAGGLWTSPLIADRVPSWAAHHMAARAPWWRVEPDPSARVLVLDTVDDFKAAIGAFPHRDAIQELISGFMGRQTAEIDFAGLAGHVDAVWMTEPARWRVMEEAMIDLVHYTTWDIETVVWLRWKVARSTRLPKLAVRRRSGG